MRDIVSVGRVAALHPLIREDVTKAIDNAEKNFPKWIAVRIVQGLRTWDEQNALYALGRTKVNPNGKTAKKPKGNIVTNASGGKSYHNYGLAIDFAILIDKDKNGTYDELSWSMVTDYDKNGVFDWQQVVKAFEDLGFEWGGRWRTFVDNPHCQKVFGYTWRKLSEMYVAKKYIKDCMYVELA